MIVIGVLGVLFYMAFLLFSLTRGDEEEHDSALAKKLDDVEGKSHTYIDVFIMLLTMLRCVLLAGEDPDADPPHPHEFGHDGEPASLL
jgi:hypothetical protein